MKMILWFFIQKATITFINTNVVYLHGFQENQNKKN